MRKKFKDKDNFLKSVDLNNDTNQNRPIVKLKLKWIAMDAT